MLTLLLSIGIPVAHIAIWLNVARYDYHLFKRHQIGCMSSYWYISKTGHTWASLSRGFCWPVWWIGLSIIAICHADSRGWLGRCFNALAPRVAHWWNKDVAIPRPERRAIVQKRLAAEQAERLQALEQRNKQLEAEKSAMEEQYPELVWHGGVLDK